MQIGQLEHAKKSEPRTALPTWVLVSLETFNDFTVALNSSLGRFTRKTSRNKSSPPTEMPQFMALLFITRFSTIGKTSTYSRLSIQVRMSKD